MWTLASVYANSEVCNQKKYIVIVYKRIFCLYTLRVHEENVKFRWTNNFC